MNEGKKFEKSFILSLEKQGFYVIRLPDPPQSFGMDSNFLRFSNKNPYDFLVYKKNTLFCLELKSCASTSFSIQFEKEEKGKDIKIHQIEGLMKAREFEGINSGFIFNFRKVNRTYYLDIKKFSNFLKSISKKSINEEDVVNHKGVLIPQTLLRTKYYYEFERVINLEQIS